MALGCKKPSPSQKNPKAPQGNQRPPIIYFNLNGSNNAASYSPLPILPNSSIRSKI